MGRNPNEEGSGWVVIVAIVGSVLLLLVLIGCGAALFFGAVAVTPPAPVRIAPPSSPAEGVEGDFEGPAPDESGADERNEALRGIADEPDSEE